MYPFFGNKPLQAQSSLQRRIRGNHRIRGVIDADLVGAGQLPINFSESKI
jgi:hypothetical protein